MEAQSRDERRNPLLYLFSKTWRYSEGNRPKVVQYWLMFIVARMFPLFGPPLVLAQTMSIIQTEGVTNENFPSLVGLMFLTWVSHFLSWAFHGPGRCIERNNAFKVRRNYRYFLLRGVMTLPMSWHVEHHSGDTIDKIEKGTNALYSFSEDSFEIIYAFVKLLVSFSVISYFFSEASLLVAPMLGLSALITLRFDRFMMGQYKILNRSENQISKQIFDSISNITTVIILRIEKMIFQAIMHKVEEPYELFKHNQRVNETKWFLTSMCAAAMTFLVLSFYFWRNIGAPKEALVIQLYLLFNYLGEISEVFFNFTQTYSEVVRQKSRVMNSEELTRDFTSENLTNHVLPKDWQRLEAKNIHFSYHKERNGYLNLEDVSMEITRGSHIGIVGATGGGKSTFFAIMRDIYRPTQGAVVCDGKVVEDGFGGISRAIALVPQVPEIFDNTVLWNITLGAEYDLEFVRRFADMACFTDVVEKLPKKFDSSINEKGVNLSGGEQQRLALARGLLACHDKDVVLLDEPTSSLDTATEMRVYRNIFREFRDKTIISSIHRLRLLPMFDKIYMFSNGRIIASGTLQHLLANCPEFQELWRQYHEHKNERSE